MTEALFTDNQIEELSKEIDKQLDELSGHTDTGVSKWIVKGNQKLPEKQCQAIPSSMLNLLREKEDGSQGKGNTGYLIFEDDEGKEALISAEVLGNMLNSQNMALVARILFNDVPIIQGKYAQQPEHGPGGAVCVPVCGTW